MYLDLVSDPPKTRKENLTFEHMMDLVIAQLSVRSLWRSVSVLERTIRRSQVLSLLGIIIFRCPTLQQEGKKHHVQKVFRIHTVSDVSPFGL